MTSIKERIETVFAAMAFAEQNLEVEAREVLEQVQDNQVARAATNKRVDSRPRLRV
jgi:hypothetical protein